MKKNIVKQSILLTIALAIALQPAGLKAAKQEQRPVPPVQQTSWSTALSTNWNALTAYFKKLNATTLSPLVGAAQKQISTGISTAKSASHTVVENVKNNPTPWIVGGIGATILGAIGFNLLRKYWAEKERKETKEFVTRMYEHSSLSEDKKQDQINSEIQYLYSPISKTDKNLYKKSLEQMHDEDMFVNTDNRIPKEKIKPFVIKMYEFSTLTDSEKWPLTQANIKYLNEHSNIDCKDEYNNYCKTLRNMYKKHKQEKDELKKQKEEELKKITEEQKDLPGAYTGEIKEFGDKTIDGGSQDIQMFPDIDTLEKIRLEQEENTKKLEQEQIRLKEEKKIEELISTEYVQVDKNDVVNRMALTDFTSTAIENLKKRKLAEEKRIKEEQDTQKFVEEMYEFAHFTSEIEKDNHIANVVDYLTSTKNSETDKSKKRKELRQNREKCLEEINKKTIEKLKIEQEKKNNNLQVAIIQNQEPIKLNVNLAKQFSDNTFRKMLGQNANTPEQKLFNKSLEENNDFNSLDFTGVTAGIDVLNMVEQRQNLNQQLNDIAADLTKNETTTSQNFANLCLTELVTGYSNIDAKIDQLEKLQDAPNNKENQEACANQINAIVDDLKVFGTKGILLEQLQDKIEKNILQQSILKETLSNSTMPECPSNLGLPNLEQKTTVTIKGEKQPVKKNIAGDMFRGLGGKLLARVEKVQNIVIQSVYGKVSDLSKTVRPKPVVKTAVISDEIPPVLLGLSTYLEQKTPKIVLNDKKLVNNKPTFNGNLFEEMKTKVLKKVTDIKQSIIVKNSVFDKIKKGVENGEITKDVPNLAPDLSDSDWDGDSDKIREMQEKIEKLATQATFIAPPEKKETDKQTTTNTNTLIVPTEPESQVNRIIKMCEEKAKNGSNSPEKKPVVEPESIEKKLGSQCITEKDLEKNEIKNYENLDHKNIVVDNNLSIHAMVNCYLGRLQMGMGNSTDECSNSSFFEDSTFSDSDNKKPLVVEDDDDEEEEFTNFEKIGNAPEDIKSNPMEQINKFITSTAKKPGIHNANLNNKNLKPNN